MPINFLNTIRIDEAAATPKVIEFGDEFIIDSTTNFTALNNLVDGGVTGIGVTDSSSVFSYAITAAPTGVILNADGAAKLASNSNGVNIIAAGSTTGIIQFRTNSSAAGDHYLGLRAPTALTGTLTYTLPLTAPTDGQVLSSTAGGVMSWATGGGSDTNIANTDLTLDADRTTDLAGFELVFDSATTDVMTLTSGDDVIIHQDLDVYGRLSPGYLKVKSPSPFTTSGTYASSAEIIFAGTIAAVSDGTCMSLGASGWGASSAASEVTAAIGLMGIKPTVTGGILTRGMVYLSHSVGGAVGDVVYLSATTAGELTTTAPTGTAGYVVRVMGYKLGTNIIFFNPSKDWIVI